MNTPSNDYKKIIVAVHGIGKQSRNSTIRSVTLMAAENIPGAPGVVSSSYPLGYFYSSGVGAAANVSPFDEIPDGENTLREIGFSEVFWADIPQSVIAESRTMEETKEWARTVVARAQRLYDRHHCPQAHADEANGVPPQQNPEGKKNKANSKLVEPDFGLAAEVLDEIIDTVYVLENLSWLAEKAGLMTFDVREVMDEYLGDVQLVAEFSYYRNDIVGRFHRAMEAIHTNHPNAEIHIVAHSEGSVVAFLGLLNALFGQRVNPAEYEDGRLVKEASKDPAGQTPLTWLRSVRGFMTIGSPIDKHFLLWPRLFEEFDLECASKLMAAGGLKEDQIKWRNYYDLADPVGFKLDTIRLWFERGGNLTKYSVPITCGNPSQAPIFPHLARNQPPTAKAEERYRNRTCKLFQFKGPEDFKDAHHDIGFTRYLLPGKAHNDYWDDVDLFNHFIQDVVNAPDEASGAAAGDPVEPPETRRKIGIISALLPFLLSALFLCSATYILLRGVITYYAPVIDPVDHYMRMMLTGYSSTSQDYNSRYLLFEFGAWALMLGGTTIGARVHRLGGLRRIWWPLAFLMITLGASLVDGSMVLSFMDIESSSQLPKPMLVAILIAICIGILAASDWFGRMQSPRKRSRKKKHRVQSDILSRRSDARERRLRWLLKGARPLVLMGAVTTLALAFIPSLGDVRLKRENLGLAISAKHLHYLKAAGIYTDKNVPEPSKEDGDEIISRLSEPTPPAERIFARIKRKAVEASDKFAAEAKRRIGTALPWESKIAVGQREEQARQSELEEKQNEDLIRNLAQKQIEPSSPANSNLPQPPPNEGQPNPAPALVPNGGTAVTGALVDNDRERLKAAKRVKEDYDNFLKVLDVSPPIWPMILSWLAFCYLWWLAILVFDLSYVWHRYVRKGGMIKCLVSWKFPSTAP